MVSFGEICSIRLGPYRQWQISFGFEMVNDANVLGVSHVHTICEIGVA